MLSWRGHSTVSICLPHHIFLYFISVCLHPLLLTNWRSHLDWQRRRIPRNVGSPDIIGGYADQGLRAPNSRRAGKVLKAEPFHGSHHNYFSLYFIFFIKKNSALLFLLSFLTPFNHTDICLVHRSLTLAV